MTTGRGAGARAGVSLRGALLLALAAVGWMAPAASAEPGERAAAAGDLLRVLEWAPGSADPSLTEDRKAWVFAPRDPTVRAPTRVFGVKYQAVPSRAPLPDADQDAAQLGAALVRAYAPDARADTGPLLEEYERFLKNNRGFVDRLSALFASLDTNGDRSIDAGEIAAAVNDGLISVVGARVLRSFDINLSKRVSWEEFRLGPVMVVVLEAHPFDLQDLRSNLPGIETRLARLYRAALGSYYVTRPEASGLLQVAESASGDRSLAPADPEMEMQAGQLPGMAEAGPEEAGQPQQQQQSDADPRFSEARAGAESEAEVQARVLEHLGLRRRGFFDSLKKVGSTIIKGVSKFVGADPVSTQRDKDVPKPKDWVDPRPKAKFGIPKYADERCVLCQYVVQRAQAELANTAVVEAKPKVYPDAPGPVPDRDAEGPQARLYSERGQRSPTRRIENVVTAIMRRVCGDTSPFLFRKPCEEIFEQRERLAYGIFRKLNAAAACVMADPLCGKETYVHTDASVHLPVMSKKFNDARGLCGFVGGPRARKYGSLDDIACFAQRLLKKDGVVRFQEQGDAALAAPAPAAVAAPEPAAAAPASARTAGDVTPVRFAERDGAPAADQGMELNEQQ